MFSCTSFLFDPLSVENQRYGSYFAAGAGCSAFFACRSASASSRNASGVSIGVMISFFTPRLTSVLRNEGVQLDIATWY
jgi:hypothetical protein